MPRNRIRYDQSLFPQYRTPSRKKERDAWFARRKEVLELLIAGHTTKQIAAKLKPLGPNAVSATRISLVTVRSYIQRIYNELEVRNLPGAVYEAIRQGILDCPCDGCPREKS